MNKKYFIVGSSGKPEEVTRSLYFSALNNKAVAQNVTLYTVDGYGETVLDKMTEETEDESFPD